MRVPGFDIVQVPVVEQGSDHWLETAKPWAGSAALAGAFTSLEARAMSLVTKSTVEVAGDQVLVELPADVLFAFSKSNLSGKAQKVVDKAGRKIAEAAAASGEITVVGHTDDQGDAASNTTLSNARAESVAERLRPILGAGFTVKTEGRGSSEPKVEGTSEEARAANRRVEITFTGRSANKLVVVDDVPTELPETTGTVVSATETARTEGGSLSDPVIDVKVVSVRRVGGNLVGRLEVSGPDGPVLSDVLFGTKSWVDSRPARDSFDISNVTLLTPASRVLASDFVSVGEVGEFHRLVGDENTKLHPGDASRPRMFVMVWPDVDPSATTVTLDAPDAYRFLDVPIS